jgi:hypothetical protein
MNPVAISALAALGGSAVGAFAPVLSSVLVQRSVARRDVANRRLAEREALYSDFLKEAARVYVSSVTHNLEDLGDLVSLYASVSRIRLRSTEPVLRAAEDVVKLIVWHFGEPNIAIEKIQGDLRSANEGGLIFGKVDPLNAFSVACRKELEDIFQSAL